MSTFDPNAIRADFPILARTVRGRPLVYLDSAATSQKPVPVLEAIDRFYRTSNANVHRSIHALAEESTVAYEAARRTLAQFIGAETDEVVFTRGTTESINLVAASWGGANLGPGDAVLLTQMEHHSNLVPWHLLAAKTGCELRFIPVTPEGSLDLDGLDGLLEERVKLLSFVHVSNTLGRINPVETLVGAARKVGARVLVDAAQSAGHMPLDVKALGADFVAFSGHKMCGPTGIGALWGRGDVLADMPPYQGGGEMIRRVTMQGSTYADPPARFEAGTPAFAEAIGLAEAARYLVGVGLDSIDQHVSSLAGEMAEALAEIPGVSVFGPGGGALPGDQDRGGESPGTFVERGGSVAFTVEGVHPHDLATLVDGEGVAIRAGHHCTQPLHDALGLASTARASVYLYSTPEDVAALVAAVRKAQQVFGVG